MPRGVQLAASVAVEQLVAVHGGSAPEELKSRVLSRIIMGRDALVDVMALGDLAVVCHRRHLPPRPGAGVFLTSSALSRELPPSQCWLHEFPLWALAGILAALERRQSAHGAIGTDDASSASVSNSAKVAQSAVLFAGAEIGESCRIEPQAVIYGRVRLGRGVVVGAGSVLGRPGFGWAFGPNGARRRMPQLGGVEIEDEVEIGPLCTVDAGTIEPTRLGARTALDAHVHVGHNVSIGADCLIAAQVGFAGSVRLGDRARVGGKAGFSDNVIVGSDVSVAAKAGVIRDVPDGLAVAGFPAVPKQRWLQAMARLLKQ